MKQHLAKYHDQDPVLGPEAMAELGQLPGLRAPAKCGPGQREQQQDSLHRWGSLSPALLARSLLASTAHL